jgi:hypothetical protein
VFSAAAGRGIPSDGRPIIRGVALGGSPTCSWRGWASTSRAPIYSLKALPIAGRPAVIAQWPGRLATARLEVNLAHASEHSHRWPPESGFVAASRPEQEGAPSSVSLAGAGRVLRAGARSHTRCGYRPSRGIASAMVGSVRTSNVVAVTVRVVRRARISSPSGGVLGEPASVPAALRATDPRGEMANPQTVRGARCPRLVRSSAGGVCGGRAACCAPAITPRSDRLKLSTVTRLRKHATRCSPGRCCPRRRTPLVGRRAAPQELPQLRTRLLGPAVGQRQSAAGTPSATICDEPILIWNQGAQTLCSRWPRGLRTVRRQDGSQMAALRSTGAAPNSS